MDWKTFIYNIIDSIIWPFALLFLCIYFNKPLMELINRIRSLKHKDTTVEFNENRFLELGSKADFHKKGIIKDRKVDPFDLDGYIEKLEYLPQKTSFAQAGTLLESEIDKLYYDIFKTSEYMAFSKVFVDFPSTFI